MVRALKSLDSWLNIKASFQGRESSLSSPGLLRRCSGHQNVSTFDNFVSSMNEN